jgi:endonuclease YncB( thermonuclease family)
MSPLFNMFPKGLGPQPIRIRHVKKFVAFIVVICAVLFPQLNTREEYNGRVVGITDGDTLTLLVEERQQVKVRLAEIDTPESAQPYGTQAKKELSALAFNREALVKEQDIDKYGRVVGRVFVDGLDVNAEMVRRGAAWVYPDYAKDVTLYVLENEAKRNRQGLWSLPESERTPPWEWRREKRN